MVRQDRFVRSKSDPGSLPAKDEDIAYAPLTKLSRWIETRQITSERLTRIYLDRLERFNPKLRCAITITRELALKQAKQADQEIAAGQVSRAAARNSLGRERSARHSGNPDHVWR